MSSTTNTVLLTNGTAISRKLRNIIQEDEEEINLFQFDNDCEVHNQSTAGCNRVRNFKYGEQENKEKRREKQLEKEYARQNQEQSNRLGKNAKKVAARRALVLTDNIPTEVEITKGKNARKLAAWIVQNSQTSSEEPIVLVSSIKSTKLFGRLKRKPGHRGKPERLPILDFEDDELEFPEM